MVGVGRGEVVEDGCGVVVVVRLATEVGVEAVVKLSVAHRMLEVMEETGADGGDRVVSAVELKIVRCSPAVSRGVGCGRTKIRALQQTGTGFARVRGGGCQFWDFPFGSHGGASSRDDSGGRVMRGFQKGLYMEESNP